MSPSLLNFSFSLTHKFCFYGRFFKNNLYKEDQQNPQELFSPSSDAEQRSEWGEEVTQDTTT